MRLTILVSALAFVAVGAVAATPDPQRWRDEYIADPARKAIIDRFTTAMEKPAYTSLRTLALAKLIATRCRGSTWDPDIVREYIAESGLGRLSRDEIELATIVANAEFSYFDLTQLKVVCAGAGRLFGEKGVLVPDLVTPGLGLPAWSESRGEHWITVAPFLIDVDGRTRSLDREAVPRQAPPPPRRRPVSGSVTAAPRRAADPSIIAL